MLRIIADADIPFLRGALEPYCDVKYLPGNLITRESLMGADALLIRTRTRCDKTLLGGTPVKFIATATIGFDHIDTEYCKEANIRWVNAPGCNSSSVQQYIIAALLMLAHKNDFSFSEKMLGIIGVGNIGSKVMEAAHLLGIRVKLNDPPRARNEGSIDFVSIEEIIETCDIITLHVPLIREGIDKTYHLFDDGLFGSVKEGSWLINSSRGEVVETRALKTALSRGKLYGAVLDVWENEPNIDIELLNQAFISTPHIAGYSTDGKANGTSMVVQELSRFFDLPLLNFYPISIPAPLSQIIRIDGSGKTCIQIVHETILQAYPIMKDHIRLQRSPESFEQQRADYANRREFMAYSVKISNGNIKAAEIFEKLGFKVKIELQ